MIKVYGDLMLDRWIEGDATRISPEAPVPVLKETTQKFFPGGAGNLAVNIASLNGEIGVYGSIAPDREGYRIIDCFSKFKKISFNASMDSKLTTTKNRLVGQGGQHIMRWDREEEYNGLEAFSRLLQDLKSKDIVCVSDYAKGTVKHNTIERLLEKDCKILVDPKQKPEYYKGAYLVKPNMHEYESWFGKYTKEKALLQLKKFGWTYLVVTDGANGMHILSTECKYEHIQEPVQEVADVTGAGDTVLAVIAYYVEQGVDMFDACKKACYAAARAVEHRGNHIVTHDDLKNNVIFTNGCFDLLHVGHLKLLEFAKSKGKKLIVGLNSDKSVKSIKGDTRPVNSQDIRKTQLESLPWVDEVILFDDDTPYDLIKSVKPDLIVKGGDYGVKDVVGHDLTDVCIFPTIKDFSSTKIIETMK